MYNETNTGFIITDDTIILILSGDVYTFDRKKQTELADEVLKAIEEANFRVLPSLVDKLESLKGYVYGDFEIRDGQLTYKGEVIEDEMSRKILEFKEKKLPFKYLLNFYKRLQKNPSYRSREQLWSFLNKIGIPITQDGYIIGWKGVHSDRYDRHSRTIQYNDGDIVRMDRAKVSDDPKDACAAGLHVGTLEYATRWAGPSGVVIACKVDPADVVRVPYDHGFSKLATCRLEVLKEVKVFREETDYNDEDIIIPDPDDFWDEEVEEECTMEDIVANWD